VDERSVTTAKDLVDTLIKKALMESLINAKEKMLKRNCY